MTLDKTNYSTRVLRIRLTPPDARSGPRGKRQRAIPRQRRGVGERSSQPARSAASGRSRPAVFVERSGYAARSDVNLVGLTRAAARPDLVDVVPGDETADLPACRG